MKHPVNKLLAACLAITFAVTVQAQDTDSLNRELELAINSGDVTRVQGLLERGAAPNFIDSSWYSMLFRALREGGRTPIVTALLEAGADPNLSSRGVPPLHQAVSGITFYGAAALDPVIALLEAGADPNLVDVYGRTPLYIALVDRPNPQVRGIIVSRLLAAGADPNRGVPLGLAAQGKLVDAVSHLLAAGADPNAFTTKRWSGVKVRPLQLAKLYDDLEGQAIVFLLLAAGADPNVFFKQNEWSSHERTPLHWMVAESHASMVAALLAAGANPNMVNEDGGLPPIHHAVTHGHSGIMAALVDAGVDLDVAYSDGATLLHHAVETGRASTVTVLLEAGADPNVGDRDGKTPLYWAAWEGSPGPIVALLKGGADHGAADNEGVTPLLVALERNNLAAVELLRGE